MSTTLPYATNGSINVTRLIDSRPIGARQLVIFGGCALVNFLDGTDNLVLAATAQPMAAALGVPLHTFWIVLPLSNLGAIAGAVLFGILADRRGSKFGLLVAALLMSGLTLATPLCTNLTSVFIVRILTGFCLGGALPCLMSLAAEFAPERKRRAIVPIVFAGQSLGLMLGGGLNAFVLGRYGWHTVYYFDGVLGLCIVGVAAAILPESLRFVIDRERNQLRARAILRQIAPDAASMGNTLTVDPEADVRVSVRELFRNDLAPVTLMLWAAFIFSFGALAAMTQWTPSFLSLSGVDAGAAARTVSFGGAGAILGLLAGSYVSERSNASWLMAASLVGAASCIVILAYSLSSAAAASLLVLLTTLLISIALAGLFALSATAYPTTVRATGVGFAVASSRAGNVGGLAAVAVVLGSGAAPAAAMIGIACAAAFSALCAVCLGLARRRYQTRALPAS